MENEITLVSDWDNSLDGIVGKIVFADSPRAHFAYEMLKLVPDTHEIRFSYTDNDGKITLSGASLVSKYGKRHPVVIRRRIMDKIRVWRRKLK